MDAGRFIASKIKFRGRLAVIAIAVSFFVIIISLAISGGFREQIRGGLASLSGDVAITGTRVNYFSPDDPILSDPSWLPDVQKVKGVSEIVPVAYRAGIVRAGSSIQGVLIKAMPSSDTTALSVSIPRRLSTRMGLKPGDEMMTYFVGERLKIRKFKVREIHDPLVEADENLIVYASLPDIQRVNGWEPNQVSALEVRLDARFRGRDAQVRKASEIGIIASMGTAEDEPHVLAKAAANTYSALFDWLELIDFNVFAILLLMTLVAGFNMISGLLIMLFRNISTIGTLKAVGMTDRSIAGVFLRVASNTVLKGLAIGNSFALLFCLVQGTTHLIHLNPANYFVSFVPVHVAPFQILAVDIVAYGAIMLLLLIPSLFISRVDPAETVRVK